MQLDRWLDDVHGALESWYCPMRTLMMWWSPWCLLMVWLMVMMEMEPACWWCSPWRWWSHVGDALMPYVFMSSLMHVVGSHAIWFLGAMSFTHDGDTVMVAWWWPWGHDGDDMIHWCYALMSFTWALMTWYIDGDDIHDVLLMEMTYMMPWLLMRFPYPFLNPSSPSHTLKPFLPPYTTPSPFLYPSAIHYLA